MRSATVSTQLPKTARATRPAAPRLSRLAAACITCTVAAATSQALAQRGGAGGGPPPARVVVEPVRLESIEQWRPVTGELRAVRRSILASKEEGLVKAISVEAGDTVEQGQQIAQLDDVIARIELDRANAVVAEKRAAQSEQEAELEKARRDLANMEQLDRDAGAPPTALADARTKVKTAEARLLRVRAELAGADATASDADQRLKDMTVRAPFTGRVVRKGTEVGQWLQRGDLVCELIDLEHLEAWLDVPEHMVGRLRAMAGAKAELQDTSEPTVKVTIPGIGIDIDAPVVAIVPEADRMSRLVPVRVRIDNPDGKIKPGMRITGSVPSGIRDRSLTVHKDAVLRDELGPFVYILAGGQSAMIRIDTLFAVGERVAVRADRLNPETLVVVEGNERLFPGQPLIPVTRDGSPVTPPAKSPIPPNAPGGS